MKLIPGVDDVQVVAVEISGHSRSAALVIPTAGAALEKHDFISRARSLMGGYKVPARVWFLAEFPTTESANGTKIQRAKLREMALERLR